MDIDTATSDGRSTSISDASTRQHLKNEELLATFNGVLDRWSIEELWQQRLDAAKDDQTKLWKFLVMVLRDVTDILAADSKWVRHFIPLRLQTTKEATAVVETFSKEELKAWEDAVQQGVKYGDWKGIFQHRCLSGDKKDSASTVFPRVSSSSPITSDTWSPRSDTVRHMYKAMQRERLIYVRGTPGCGKTTLIHLLHAYILNQEPNAVVRIVHSWPQDTPKTPGPEYGRLRAIDPKYPNPRKLTYLLFDEGQDSYKDFLLWNTFLMSVGDGGLSKYRAIVFCTYGSPYTRPFLHHNGTLLTLSPRACISLVPRDDSVGLLLNREEFTEVVARFGRGINLHDDLQDMIFSWTAGHVGAVVKLLEIISSQTMSESRQGMPFTVEDFHKHNPTSKLIERLCSGVFVQGLPCDVELQSQPEVVNVLRSMLLGDVIVTSQESEDNIPINICQHRGWIHSDRTPDILVRYMFPSPLHAVCMSWTLKPTNDMLIFDSIFALSITVISNLNPSKMQFPIWRIGAQPTDRPLYEDEFYRSLFSVTIGNVRFSPEFASGQGSKVAGCIDFFIPTRKWGIKITREGNGLEEHSSRFATPAAYGAWLKSYDMDDYILLDCCSSIPAKQYPNIPDLYHVVFGDGYRDVVVYDHQVRQVGKRVILLENGSMPVS